MCCSLRSTEGIERPFSIVWNCAQFIALRRQPHVSASSPRENYLDETLTRRMLSPSSFVVPSA